MPKQKQSPKILFNKTVSINVEWLQNNQFGRVGEISTFYTDNPQIPLFIGSNFFQVFYNDRWRTFWKGHEYKTMKRNYKKKTDA
jgi:hypothetical protein